QVRLEKRYSKGLSYGLAYTLSKVHGDGEAGGNESVDWQNPRDRLGSRGRLRFDQRHNMVVHFVYELPFAKGFAGVPGALLKGWQTNGILSLRSGFPFTPVVGSGELNTGGGSSLRPDRLADGSLPGDQRSRVRWFDPSAFRRVSCNIRN